MKFSARWTAARSRPCTLPWISTWLPFGETAVRTDPWLCWKGVLVLKWGPLGKPRVLAALPRRSRLPRFDPPRRPPEGIFIRGIRFTFADNGGWIDVGKPPEGMPCP